MDQRKIGWLSEAFHDEFRWRLLHGCARYDVACPVCCLMPDHAHLMVTGWTRKADQLLFMPWLRRHTIGFLKGTGHVWQKQAYDHVLRPQVSDRFAFQSLARYITENPVRAGLVGHAHA